MGSNFTATRVNIHDVDRRIHLTAGDVTLKESWMHDNHHFEKDPLRNDTPTHDDSFRSRVDRTSRSITTLSPVRTMRLCR